jgi:hypothetical protein
MATPGYPRYIKHGERQSGAYSSWAAMKSRCSNPKNVGYSRYGGIGVTVCERWQNFENFLSDMGPRPPGHTIDRIDGSGNYEPGNCRWASRQRQSENRPGFCKDITHNGITDTISGWARRIDCDREALSGRIESGWPIREALTEPFSSHTPYRKTPRIEHDGKSLTLKQWSRVSGIPDDTIRYRIKTGWPIKEAIFSPTLTNSTRHTRKKT